MAANLKKADLIYPYFVTHGRLKKEEISLFPGQYRLSRDLLLKDMEELKSLGINKILLFGIPYKKDARGTGAYDKDGIVSLAVRDIKKNFPSVTVFTDVCLCAYTDHGHCRISEDPQATLEALAETALAHAEAGADWVAPSAMAKGQVAAIRKALDKNGFRKTKILAYSAKFASGFYGPFRNAADSAPKSGDRKGYQLDYTDPKAALARIKSDIDEGADMVMVKPALAYLDIVRQARDKFKIPLAAYNVSGEYAFVKYGAKAGLWNEGDIVRETLLSIKRAGADRIITYHAKEAAKWLSH